MKPDLRFERGSEGQLCLRLAGSWLLSGGLVPADGLERELAQGPAVRELVLDAAGVDAWDTSLLTFLTSAYEVCARKQIPIDASGLPEGLRRLVDLARKVPEREGARKVEEVEPLLDRVGNVALGGWSIAGDYVSFVGEVTQAFVRLLQGKARFRRADLMMAFEQAGATALPIASLIAFLIGGVLAFVGAVQLEKFGATLWVAALVAIATTRETGALMTGIVLAGRTGASFAAVLGTMTVNEEVDALETMGLPPIDFLVLPRVLALALMTPLLVLYADLVGIIGGLFVGVTVLDLNASAYLTHTQEALNFKHLAAGLVKSVLFGVAVAMSGCYYGIRCGRSASAVGEATTSAVVIGIVLVVVWDAALTVVFHFVGF